jgi:hypothetical protein
MEGTKLSSFSGVRSYLLMEKSPKIIFCGGGQDVAQPKIITDWRSLASLVVTSIL